MVHAAEDGRGKGEGGEGEEAPTNICPRLLLAVEYRVVVPLLGMRLLPAPKKPGHPVRSYVDDARRDELRPFAPCRRRRLCVCVCVWMLLGIFRPACPPGRDNASSSSYVETHTRRTERTKVRCCIRDCFVPSRWMNRWRGWIAPGIFYSASSHTSAVPCRAAGSCDHMMDDGPDLSITLSELAMVKSKCSVQCLFVCSLQLDARIESFDGIEVMDCYSQLCTPVASYVRVGRSVLRSIRRSD
jgi:hypothetical protein